MVARSVRPDQVFWTTMFGNFEVMSFCDSAMRTAQRRATCLYIADTLPSGSATSVGLPESAFSRIEDSSGSWPSD